MILYNQTKERFPSTRCAYDTTTNLQRVRSTKQRKQS